MFAGFNLESTRDFFERDFDYYKKVGEEHLRSKKKKIGEAVCTYISNNVISGTQLQDNWFPQIDADIFISHSHIDEDLAFALAGWIHKTFNLECFIDSCVWGYSNNLSEKLNDKYSNKRENSNGGYLYDHESCNTVSKHVNTMLSIALQKMIDKTEVVFLLNTSNSIKENGDVSDVSTYSPWIYSEITCTEIVKNKPLLVYRNYQSTYEIANENTMQYKMAVYNALMISYNVSLKHLTKLNTVLLSRWKDTYKRDTFDYALDALYKFTYPKELEKTKRSFINISTRDINNIKAYYQSGDDSKINILNEKMEFACESVIDNFKQTCQNCRGEICPYLNRKDGRSYE